MKEKVKKKNDFRITWPRLAFPYGFIHSDEKGRVGEREHQLFHKSKICFVFITIYQLVVEFWSWDDKYPLWFNFKYVLENSLARNWVIVWYKTIFVSIFESIIWGKKLPTHIQETNYFKLPIGIHNIRQKKMYIDCIDWPTTVTMIIYLLIFHHFHI